MKKLMHRRAMEYVTLAAFGRVAALPAKAVGLHKFEFVFPAAGTVENVHCNLRV